MKGIIIIFFLTIGALSLKAQSNFVKGSLYGFSFLGLTENADTTLTLTGTALDTNYTGPFPFLQHGAAGVSFVKFDRLGNELSRRVYGSLLDERPVIIKPIIESGVSNYLVLGETWSFAPPPPSNYLQAYLLKLDANGDTIWTRAYDIGFIDYLSILTAYDNTYMLGSANGQAATLTKINPVDGDTIWTRWYTQPIGQSIGSTSIQLAPDSGYYLGGIVIPPGMNNACYMLLKTDTAGILQWGKAYGTNIRPLQCWDMIKLSTGELLMIGQTDINSQSDIGIIKLNAMGDTVWCHKYAYPSNIYEIGSTALEDNDGNYVIAGVDNESGKAELFKIDTNGNVIWAWKYNWSGNMSMTLKKAYDGGYWIASGFLIKLDSTGYGCTAVPQVVGVSSFPLDITSISPLMDGGARACIRTNTQEFINTIPVGDLCVYLGVEENPKSNDELVIYPNPVLNKLSVSSAQLANKKVTVTLYDVLGKQKLQKKYIVSVDGKMEMDVSSLESGIYFIRINNNVQRLVKM